MNVGMDEPFENIQLARNSQRCFTGDHTAQQRLLMFSYISGQGHEPNRSVDTTKIQVQSIVGAKMNKKNSFRSKSNEELYNVYTFDALPCD
jgi:hypothetical protein